MAVSAPSLAYAMATARPIPLSPPVISATLFSNLPLPPCSGPWLFGRGVMSFSSPGCRDCCCGGRCCFDGDIHILSGHVMSFAPSNFYDLQKDADSTPPAGPSVSPRVQDTKTVEKAVQETDLGRAPGPLRYHCRV